MLLIMVLLIINLYLVNVQVQPSGEEQMLDCEGDKEHFENEIGQIFPIFNRDLIGEASDEWRRLAIRFDGECRFRDVGFRIRLE